MKIAKTDSKPKMPPVGVSTDEMIPLEHIVNHKELPNRKLDKAHAEELFHSIRRSGLDTPLIVWGGDKEGVKMKLSSGVVPASFLIAGAHRRAALQRLQDEEPARFKELFADGIRCVRRICSLEEALFIQLRENVARKNPEPETILPIMQHLEGLGLKHNVIAARIGKSTGWVSQIFDITKNLGEEGVEVVKEGGASMRELRKAAQDVKKGKSDAKTAVAKLKEKVAKKKASGKQRAEKKVSLKVLFNRYTLLPKGKFSAGSKLQMLEGICEYIIGESDEIPEALTAKESDDEESEE